MKVWRDAGGNVVNIGEWDHQIISVIRNPFPADIENRPERVPVLIDGKPVTRVVDGGPGVEPRVEQVMTYGPNRWFRGEELIHEGEWDWHREEVESNPIPEGVTCAEEEVCKRVDGGLAAADDYASLRRAAYPTTRDQLDALWKGGADIEAMRAQVLAVKDRYPKADA
jgi:hypothetical protein